MILRTTPSKVRKDPALLARLQELTIGAENNSAMLFVLEGEGSAIFVSMRDGRAVGWAFLLPTQQVGIYVDPVWRRIGVGTALMKAIGPNMIVYPSDDGGAAFFESIGSVTIVDTRTNPGSGI